VLAFTYSNLKEDRRPVGEKELLGRTNHYDYTSISTNLLLSVRTICSYAAQISLE